jgi:hypothetical protein
MSRHAFSSAALSLALLGTFFLGSKALAAPKDSAKDAPKTTGTASGLIVDMKKEFMTVQHDGEAEPTKYLYANGAGMETLTHKMNIFGVDRVNIKYKLEGEDRRITAIEKVPGKSQGVIVGEVVKVYNNFWVAVKPKTGMIEGFALNWPPEKFKQSHDLIKTLNPGDQVAIKYGTDFERHRILQMEVRPAQSKSPSSK